jgi:membrane associated rhomboid family serine protease
MPTATGLFLGANILAFIALAALEGGVEMSPRLMIEFGGLVPLQWLDGQYWRLLSYGFLHFSLMHITVNAICLLAWGVPLERMMGSARLAFLYLGSIVIAGAGSILLHKGPFVSAGASGGVSGLLGALFLLYLLRKIAMPGSFFAVNIGLNIAIALFAPGIDWQAHLAGFLGGMALVGVMLVVARRARR